MSDTGRPPVLDPGFDENFDKELIQMWQEHTCPMPGEPSELTRQLAGWLRKFDRRIFWRNFVEYAAGVIVLIRSAFDISSGERLLFAPLTGVAATLFVMIHIWRRHRSTPAADPAATAAEYRQALLHRLDHQIRFARGVRYWYVLPCWLFFVAVLASGIIQLNTNPPQLQSQEGAVMKLLMAFLSASALCVVVVWLNENYAVRKLREERERVAAVVTESKTED
jgi:hypothetical protein